MSESSLKVTSPGFNNGERLPAKYANIGVAGGQNLSPPLVWEGAPEGTGSFAVACIDIHPVANNFVHWLVINIPANITSLSEGASSRNMPAGSVELRTTYGVSAYGGGRPPAGTGEHDYVFTVYSLSVDDLGLSASATYTDFQKAATGRVLDSVSITGKFSQ